MGEQALEPQFWYSSPPVLDDQALKMWAGDYTRNAYLSPQIMQFLGHE